MVGPMPGRSCSSAEAGDAVARVLGEAEAGEHVLDVGGVEEFQPAIFDEGDVAAGELQLQPGAVVRGAEEHGLALQEHPGLAVLEDALDDGARLVGLVAHRHQLGQVGGEPARAEVLGEALGGEADHGIGGGEDRLRSSGSSARASRPRPRGVKAAGKSRMLRTVAARKE